MQVSSTVQVGRSRAGSAHTNGRVPRHEDNGNSCGCCIDLTRDDSEGSDVEMLEADDVAITRLSLDDVAPASTPLRDPYAVGFSHAGNASSSYGARHRMMSQQMHSRASTDLCQTGSAQCAP